MGLVLRFRNQVRYIFGIRYLRGLQWRRRLRAYRMRRQLQLVHDNLFRIGRDDIIVFVTVRNEYARIPYFLEYYRKLGVYHFIFIDNNSDDGTVEYLGKFSDVSLYFTTASYRRSHFGVDWINGLLQRHARDHWALVVDIDEFLVYPHMDKRDLTDLTHWLEISGKPTMSTQLLDLYPSKKLSEIKFDLVKDPFDTLTHFDYGNYSYKREVLFHNLWIQGGVRARLFFTNNPERAPALNKTPLIKWKKSYCYISSTHTLLPRHLNETYTMNGQGEICGVLLHAKFLPDITHKVEDPHLLSQHYSKAREYQSYSRARLNELNFISEHSVAYENWQQLEALGILSAGGWV